MKIDEDQIHIWHINLNATHDAIEEFKKSLPLTELSHANRLSHTDVQRRFIVRRAALHIILAKYLSKKAITGVDISRTEKGKPYLANNNPLGITFNVSHSEDSSLLALSRKENLGVDIERTGRIKCWLGVMKLSMSQYEQDEILKYSKHEQEAAFIRVWTRKEAYTKAIGDGFFYSFTDFSVSVKEESPQIFEDKNNKQNISKWSMINLDVVEPFIASLSVDSSNMRLVYHSF